MALVDFFGFEGGAVPPGMEIMDGAVLQSSVSGMTGYCLYVPSDAQAYYTLNTALSEIFMGFFYRPINNPTNPAYILAFRNASGQVMASLRRYAGAIAVVYGEGTTVMATGSATFTEGAVYRIRIQYKPHDTTGVFKVWVDEVLDIDFSGDSGDNIGDVKSMRFGRSNYMGVGHIDSIVIDNAEIPSPYWAVGSKAINGAGTVTQLTSIAGGSNWNEVSDAPEALSDGVYGNTNGLYDGYSMADLSGQIESIRAVKVQSRVVKNGGTALANAQLGVRTYSTDYFSASKAVTLLLGRVSEIWTVNPNTSAAWTISEVEAMQAIIKVVT